MSLDTGDNISAQSGLWSFGGDTPKSFDNHVSKSVPFYHEGHKIISALSEFFVPRNGSVLHVGSATGSLTQSIADQLQDRDASIDAIDIEENMIKESLSRNYSNSINFYHSDITTDDLSEKKYNMIVCYYTIQFIHPSVRQAVIDKLYTSLHWGGALLLFEKIRANDARFQDIFNISYQDYKITRGYTPENIYAKQSSLKSVLEPFSYQGNIDMLQRSGFIDIESIFRYLCFHGFLAIK